MEQGELATNIKSILNEFPPQQQKVFSLIYMENKRYQEAADEMGISINSVKTHLKLALKIFRVKLKKFR
ncbi:MAG: sigma-70 family RNA polymerase sigma factor [Thermoflavifilum aggregans]|nr:sigma-70 family RNA polymerase sigma factor [Thermoflavifilum aggregans]